MLDLYPETKLSAAPYTRAQDPSLSLEYFDSGNYIIQKSPGSTVFACKGV